VITYVDTSTLLTRLLAEDGSPKADIIWNAGDVLTSAVTVIVEARAALAAAQRGGRITADEHNEVKAELVDLLEEITFIETTDGLITEAGDLAEAEALRGHDAIHLAAALAIAANVVTSADSVLCEAAERRGLHVANPLDA
jgi:hypothetical protein